MAIPRVSRRSSSPRPHVRILEACSWEARPIHSADGSTDAVEEALHGEEGGEVLVVRKGANEEDVHAGAREEAAYFRSPLVQHYFQCWVPFPGQEAVVGDTDIRTLGTEDVPEAHSGVLQQPGILAALCKFEGSQRFAAVA